MGFSGDLRWVARFGLKRAKSVQVKAPVGRVNKKYVYSSFMVKMAIDLGSFSSFWVGDHM